MKLEQKWRQQSGFIWHISEEKIQYLTSKRQYQSVYGNEMISSIEITCIIYSEETNKNKT